MSSVTYEGKKVNSSIHDLKALSGRFPGVASRVQSLTSAMVSCRGFNHIGSGVTSTSFSSEINNSASELDGFVSKVRNMQVSILSYSNEENDIQEFLDDLDRKEYKDLDLSGIESHIGVGRKLTNGFKSLAATLFTAGAGVVEGVCDFVETGADLIELGKSAVGTIFTGTYDLFTGSDTTKQMWEATKAKVSEKKVENAFNNFYNNTEFGQSIKNNAYGFDTVRGISSGLGYTAGIIGLNVVTGGLASGLGIGAAGSVGAGQLAATAGLMGFSSGTEDAWADGASIGKGLLYGAATGAWEGTQWAIGAKINQYGGVGDKIASGIFKGGKSGAVTRVVLDTVDSGLEGFVQPGLKMIYKDYEGNSFADKYQNAFKEAGGWANVRNQAIMGGIMSAGSEFMDARKILKSSSKGNVPDTPKAFGGGDVADYRSSLISEDSFAREMMEDQMAAAGDYTKHSRATIDGKYIKTADTEFNTSTCTSGVPSGSIKFLDGSYVPVKGAAGAFLSLEKYYDGQSFKTLLDSKKDTISGLTYTRYSDASQIFASHGKQFNMTELKLIINHSEGNVGRIKSAISMSDPTIPASQLDEISDQLAKKLFPKSSNIGVNINRRVLNSIIDELQANNNDNWRNSRVIFDDIFSVNEALSRKNASTYSSKLAELRKMNSKGTLSDNLMRKIVASDGYPESIISILKKDTDLSSERILKIAEGISAKVFKAENAARIKAQYEVCNGSFDSARRLVADSSASYHDATVALMRSGETFSQKAKRFAYYSVVDDSIGMGLDKESAKLQAKLMYCHAMDQVGSKSAKDSAANLFKGKSNVFGFSDDMLDAFEHTTLPDSGYSAFMSQYVSNNGHTINRTKLSADFLAMMGGKDGTTNRPSYFRDADVDPKRTAEAIKLFSAAYNDAAFAKTGNPREALKVMAKLLDLEQNGGKKLFVYNNAGKSGSHRSGSTINLCNQTVDIRDYSTVIHETGHYLFDHVLSEKIPTGFPSVRQLALDNLYSPHNSGVLKIVKSNISEVKMFCEYKSTTAVASTLAKKGYPSINAYKKHLVDVYSARSTADRVSSLLDSTTQAGDMLVTSFDKKIRPNFGFDDALNCANLELNSMRNKVTDSINRKTGSFTDITGMINTLTMSHEDLWYGHPREYFEGAPNPIRNVYHELMADYTALRVKGDTKSIGLLRHLFGEDMMDMLEKTYQDMLK